MHHIKNELKKKFRKNEYKRKDTFSNQKLSKLFFRIPRKYSFEDKGVKKKKEYNLELCEGTF